MPDNPAVRRCVIDPSINFIALIMSSARFAIIALLLLTAGAALSTGCGATRSTDTLRTATEQLLISDAIDRAVEQMDLKPLSGQTVFLDDTKVTEIVDRNYYISTLRQQLLASGCELRDKREEADFIVEARAGAVGTDRNDLLFGLPSMNVPQIPLVQPVPAAIPEIPIAKRRDQRGIAKIAVFAYHRATGAPVWQSGIVRQESSANDVWIFGAGPFQRGTIYDGTAFAGKAIKNEDDHTAATHDSPPSLGVARETLFTSPAKFAKKDPASDRPPIELASHQELVPPAKPIPVPRAENAPAVPPDAAQTIQIAPPKPTNELNASALPTPSAASAAMLNPNGSSKPASPAASPSTSTYARVEADSTPLPQPRFNSPR